MAEDIGITRYIENAFSAAETPEDIEAIEDQLIEEGFNRSTIRVIKSKVLGRMQSTKRIKIPTEDIPTKLSRRDTIPIERDLMWLTFDGDYRQGVADGIRLLLIARKYDQMVNMEHIETLKTLTDALKSIKSESDKVAYEAAYEAAKEVGSAVIGAIDSKQKPEQSPLLPIYSMLGRAIENIVSKMFPQLTSGNQLPGFTFESRKRQVDGGDS